MNFLVYFKSKAKMAERIKQLERQVDHQHAELKELTIKLLRATSRSKSR